jgi:N-acetyl sugar amidotransferase
MKTLFGSPEKVIFCKECTMSNQRPSTIKEYEHDFSRTGSIYLNIGDDGVCDACKYNKLKYKGINWELREKELLELLDKNRKSNGDYDCLVPGSGGKDSIYAAHVLKYKYGMNPLTTTWPPILYTDYGYKNFLNWLDVGGFDNVTYKPNGRIMKQLTKLSVINLLHPFQTFILGQKNLAPKIAKNFGIKLIFYGEPETEYGRAIAETNDTLMKSEYYSYKNKDKILLAGLSLKELEEKHNITSKDVSLFLPINSDQLKNTNFEFHYLGYYLKWIPQENYYYSVKHADFQPRPFRTEGTYSKYSSIDNKIDDLFYWTYYIKFGLGRASQDAAQEIRNGHINLEEAMRLVKKFDGEFPSKYFDDVLNYIDLSKEEFFNIVDKFRPNHLWKKTGNGWKLRHTKNKDGYDD